MEVYFITFAVLLVGTLAALTFMLDEMNKSYMCTTSPDPWCSDEWTCKTVCPQSNISPDGNPVNSCYGSRFPGKTGLPSCLMGEGSEASSLCFEVPESPTPNCPCKLNNASNCLSGCALNTDSIDHGSAQPICCCKEGQGPNCTPEACQ